VRYRREQESTLARVSSTLEEQRREVEERLEDRSEAVERVAERLRRRELELESTRKNLEHGEDELRRLQQQLDAERSKHGRMTLSCCFVSDIAIFVLKRNVKLQLTN